MSNFETDVKLMRLLDHAPSLALCVIHDIVAHQFVVFLLVVSNIQFTHVMAASPSCKIVRTVEGMRVSVFFWIGLVSSCMSSKERTSPMKDCIYPSDALPVMTLALEARRLTPIDFKDLPYSPMLLLSAHFDAALVDDPEYQEGCEWGFNSYFAEMCHWTPDLSTCTFVDCYHSSAQVRQYLLHEVIYDPVRNPISLACRAGWGLGWLSALALTDRSLALMGLELLQELVLHDESDGDESEYNESDC